MFWVRIYLFIACHSLICLLENAAVLVAQPVGATPKFRNPAPITSFGYIQLFGGVIIIRAAIDEGKDSLNFILDTGSGGISIDSATVEELKIPTVPSDKTIRGIAGVRKVNFAYNHSLRLPGLKVDSLDFHINNYEMLTGVYGVKVDGIIGFSFLRRYTVAINFDKRLVTVYPPGRFNYPSGGDLLKPALTGLPMQYAEITDDHKVGARYFIDTGAGLCLLLNNDFTRDSAIIKPHKKLYPSVAEGIGGKKEMGISYVKKFKLGRYQFKNMPVFVFDDEFNVTSYPFLAGLIGNDLLRRFNLTINYSMSEVHLLPNQAFREAFDYAYTGFNMYQDEHDVLIIDVMKDSPAERAGLRDGDIIISAGNKFAGNIQEYKTVLQHADSKIKMVISRNGELEEVLLRIATIKKNYKKAKTRK